MGKRLLQSLLGIVAFIAAAGVIMSVIAWPEIFAIIITSLYLLFWLIMWIRWLITGKF